MMPDTEPIMKDDWIHRLAKWADYNRWTVIGVTLAIVMVASLGIFQGCESTTIGFKGEKVTRDAFVIESMGAERTLGDQKADIDAAIAKHNESVKAYNAMVDAGTADLDRQDEYRAELLTTLGSVATAAAAGGFNPVALIPIAVGLLGTLYGVGKKADNIRKDTVITELKIPTTTPTA